MPRPLMQLGIGQLEGLFSTSKTDPKLLKELEYELQHRQVPRAVALLAEVQAAMHGETVVSPWTSTPAQSQTRTPLVGQSGLWDRPAEQLAPVLASASVSAVDSAEPAVRQPERPPIMKPAVPPVTVISVEDAYKLLKATAGSTWDSIEQTRRIFVMQSHPKQLKAMSSEKRNRVLAEANLVNAAYAVLSRARCERL
jgi:hypothetical protein